MNPLPTLAVATLLVSAVSAQSLINSTNYSDLFSPPGNVTVDAPSPLLGLTLGGSASGPLGNYWSADATGGASLSVLGLGVVDTGAQVSLSGNALEFNISNQPNTLLGALGTGASLSFGWSATATFDQAGQELTLTPATIYQVSFDLMGNDTLLSSTAGLLPSFGVELLDGAGNPIGSAGGDTLVDILGLSLLSPVVGNPVGDSRATVTFITPSSVDSAPASLRFTGDASLSATALGIGTNFATISNVNITAVPEPSCMLLAFGAIPLFCTRRRR